MVIILCWCLFFTFRLWLMARSLKCYIYCIWLHRWLMYVSIYNNELYIYIYILYESWFNQLKTDVIQQSTRFWFFQCNDPNSQGIKRWPDRTITPLKEWSPAEKYLTDVLICLVVWNIFLFFHVLGIIIPTDFHIFQRCWNHQAVIMF